MHELAEEAKREKKMSVPSESTKADRIAHFKQAIRSF